MDEIEHLLSSLEDHLDAAGAKSLSDDVEEEVEEAQSIAAGLLADDPGHDRVHEDIEDVLGLLEEMEEESTGNDEADRHLDAARRAAERVLDR